MNFSEYVKKAVATAAPNKTNMSDIDFNITHSSLGILSEINELKTAKDALNIIEELGDILWYVALGAQAVIHTPEDISETENWHTITTSYDALDQIKSVIAYGKLYDEDEFKNFLNWSYTLVLDFLKRAPFVNTPTIEALYHSNLLKLQGPFGRYASGGYTAQQEKARKKEANTLIAGISLALPSFFADAQEILLPSEITEEQVQNDPRIIEIRVYHLGVIDHDMSIDALGGHDRVLLYKRLK